MVKNVKVERIIDIALELLKAQGDHGVTMRQIAQRAGMSLSNVQYYFKSKDDLLKAMADRYFRQCLDDFQRESAISNDGDMRKNLRTLVRTLLAHGTELSEMCRIFREYWAIATRNSVIEVYLQDYYQEMSELLTQTLRPFAKNQEGLSAAVTLLLPYVEGYSIASESLPLEVEGTTDMVTRLLLYLLDSDL